LFINLSDESWGDMGITNRFHVRKLQLILKSYRVRYQRRKDKVEMAEDDDLLSEISPSELSEMIAAEDHENDAYSSDESSSVSVSPSMPCLPCLVAFMACCSAERCASCQQTITTHALNGIASALLSLYFPLQEESYQSEDELMVGLTEEQKLQKQLDGKNITVKLSVRGDGANFPVSFSFCFSFLSFCFPSSLARERVHC
jgi:hypothetical protein